MGILRSMVFHDFMMLNITKQKLSLMISYKDYHRDGYTPFLMLHHDERLTRIEPQPFHQDYKGDNYYDMSASKHGLALIFNNETFIDKKKQRFGTARDEENIRRTCYYLGYCPIVFRQFRRKEVLDLFKNLDSFIGNFNDEMANDSLLCFFLTHGNEGIIFSSDKKSIPIAEIERLVGNSDKLNSKPKIFFIQACQGETLAEAKKLTTPPDQDGGDDHAQRTDIYKFFATVPGESAYRHPGRGSWFVLELCHILCELATSNNVFNLQIELNRRISDNDSAIPEMSYRFKSEGKTYAMTPYGGLQLRRQFQFFNKNETN